MSTAATISIIIPSKNEAAYIGPTIEQFGAYFEAWNLEVIVSDANSTDGTAEIVEQCTQKYGAHRVKLVQSTQKQNIAIGRNLGAAAATGTWLLHTDADVRIPEKDRFFKTILARFDNPKVVAATVPLWVYPEEVTLKDKIFHIVMNGIIWLSFPFGIYLAKGECQFVRRSVFEEIEGYDEKIIAGEDCNLFYRLHKKGKIAYIRTLFVHHSPRRFRAYGYLPLFMIYLREGLWLLFRRKSYSTEWKQVR
jgi:glycosyltransferase involved in cell wall biosynthesis